MDARGSHVSALATPGVVGDGLHDDTAGLQAALDSGAAVVHLPTPPAGYLITRPLVIHSGQTLLCDRNAALRLADRAHRYMLVNDDPERGNRGISIIGGIWDGNNAHQTCEYHEGGDWRVPFSKDRYLGVLMQLVNVDDLHLSGLTLKDPECYGIQLGAVRRFTVQDITFDYNMLTNNMDGVHVHGPASQGRIANLKGATNDDQVALNADDGAMFEVTRGPITDVEIQGVWAENGYTGVRLLSAGSPISRVRISGLYGSFRYYGVSFTHHNVHPGEPSTVTDVVIDGMHLSRPPRPEGQPLPQSDMEQCRFPLIWVEGGMNVGSLLLSNLVRTEAVELAPPAVLVSEGAKVRHLGVCNAAVANLADSALDFIVNRGTIESLSLANVCTSARSAATRGTVVRNTGTINHTGLQNVVTCTDRGQRVAE